MFAIDCEWTVYNQLQGQHLNLCRNGCKVLDIQDITSIGREIGKSNPSIDGIGDYVRSISVNPRDIVLKVELMSFGYDVSLSRILNVCSASSSILLIGSNALGYDGEGAIAGIVTDLTIGRFASRVIANITVHCADPYFYRIDDSRTVLIKKRCLKEVTMDVATKPNGFSTAIDFPMELYGVVPSRISGEVTNLSYFTYWGKCVISSSLKTERVDGTDYYPRQINKNLTVVGEVNNANSEIYTFAGNQRVEFSNVEGDIYCNSTLNNNITHPSVFYQGDLTDFYVYPKTPSDAYAKIKIEFIVNYGDLTAPTEETAQFNVAIYGTDRWI